MFNYECQPHPSRKPYAHMINEQYYVAVFLHMYKCLQNRNVIFAGSDNAI